MVELKYCCSYRRKPSPSSQNSPPCDIDGYKKSPGSSTAWGPSHVFSDGPKAHQRGQAYALETVVAMALAVAPYVAVGQVLMVLD